MEALAVAEGIQEATPAALAVAEATREVAARAAAVAAEVVTSQEDNRKGGQTTTFLVASFCLMGGKHVLRIQEVIQLLFAEQSML